jgi:hypothetical protein
MKKLLILALLPILFSFSKEKKSLEFKLREVYTNEICEQILKNPSQAKYFEVLLFQSVILTQEKKSATAHHDILKETTLRLKNGDSKTISNTQLIQMIKNGSLNALQLEIERELNNNVSYKLGDSNYVLTLLSHSQINNLAKK